MPVAFPERTVAALSPQRIIVPRYVAAIRCYHVGDTKLVSNRVKSDGEDKVGRAEPEAEQHQERKGAWEDTENEQGKQRDGGDGARLYEKELNRIEQNDRHDNDLQGPSGIAKEVDVTVSGARIIFDGAVVHVLIGLEGNDGDAGRKRKSARKRRSEAQHHIAPQNTQATIDVRDASAYHELGEVAEEVA